MALQRLVHAIYPPQCVGCEAQTTSDDGLCPSCWAETQFIRGAVCHTCGAPLPGHDDGSQLSCDDCLQIARGWSAGRAALIYAGKGRSLVLGLKHGDRLDLARPAARWMAGAAQPILTADSLLVPIPLHWRRLVRRRYNQAAELTRALARQTGCSSCVDALLRPQSTKPLDGHNRDARFAALQGAIHINPRRADLIRGRAICLIDDVMTSGATFAAATEALLRAGAGRVCVLSLARVVKDA